MKCLTIVSLAVVACGVCCADAPKTLKACVFQPPYALDMADVDKSMQWEFDTLKKCDPSLDLIVLPEASDRQGRPRSREESIAAAKKYNASLLAACAETAKRCGATVFVNALDFSQPSPRNTTFAFDKTGACVGKYDKEHLTAGEWKKYKFDESYMWKWSEPKILEIDGVRYAFLT